MMRCLLKVEKFLETDPCLEEIDGYVRFLYWQIENPKLLKPFKPTYKKITGDVMAPLAVRRAELQKAASKRGRR